MPATPARHHVVELVPHEIAVHALAAGHVAGQHARLVVDAVRGAIGLVAARSNWLYALSESAMLPIAPTIHGEIMLNAW